MEWSYSASKRFIQCQRRWYFHHIMANSHPNAKSALRRKAFLFSKLQSIEAWRGSVVDKVIETKLIPRINRKKRISEEELMRDAKRLFDDQLQFGIDHRSCEEGMTITKAGDKYAAFYAIEYGHDIKDEDVNAAWEDVETALLNLLYDDELMSYLYDADYLVSQRGLTLSDDDFSIVAIPDVIAFYEDQPPLIIDWKVQSEGDRDYWLQLASYAYVLTTRKPHSDFERANPQRYLATDVRLAEVQLLLPEIRWYDLTEVDVDAVEDHIYLSAESMLRALGHKDNNILRPLDFSPTQFPEQCQTCPFQKMCIRCGVKELWVN